MAAVLNIVVYFLKQLVRGDVQGRDDNQLILLKIRPFGENKINADIILVEDPVELGNELVAVSAAGCFLPVRAGSHEWHKVQRIVAVMAEQYGNLVFLLLVYQPGPEPLQFVGRF
jgi:hypothetical protein